MVGIIQLTPVLLLCLPWLAVLSEEASEDGRTEVVPTKYGRVQGFVTRVGRDASVTKFVKVFQGVPYASPPTGNFRFAPTRPPTHWSGVLSAVTPGPVCPQHLSPDDLSLLTNRTRERLTHQSEDCLNLNLYVPQQKSKSMKEKFTVMVYIHGESYLWGSGSLLDGRVLAAYGQVIVVTINYRIGVLGFLNTNTAPHQHPRMANYGIMDQIAALKWVQQNIENFGGDPGSVTLFGYRTGAACIHFLMESPAAVTGLFHRAILMSGSGVAPWSMVEDPVHYAVKLAAGLNCTLPSNMVKNHLHILDCLRSKPLSSLLSADLKAPSFLSSVGPSRDGVLIPSDFGLHSFQIKKRSTTPSYQVLVGVSEEECFQLFSQPQEQEGITGHEKNRILRSLVRNCYNFHTNEIFFTIENEYSDIYGETAESRKELVYSAVRDKLYSSPAIETVNWANETGYPPFLYVHKQTKRENGEPRCDFLNLVFGLPFAPELAVQEQEPVSTESAVLSQQIISFWTNFAQSGNPNTPNRLEDLFPTALPLPTWKQYTLKDQNYMELDIDSESRSHYRARTMSVWLKLIPKLHMSGSDHLYTDRGGTVVYTANGRADTKHKAQPYGIIHEDGHYGPADHHSGNPRLHYTPCSAAANSNGTSSAAVIGSNNNNDLSAHNINGQQNTISLSEPSSVLLGGSQGQAVLVCLSLGILVVAANVWCWVCFVVKRRTVICCLTNERGGSSNSSTGGNAAEKLVSLSLSEEPATSLLVTAAAANVTSGAVTSHELRSTIATTSASMAGRAASIESVAGDVASGIMGGGGHRNGGGSGHQRDTVLDCWYEEQSEKAVLGSHATVKSSSSSGGANKEYPQLTGILKQDKSGGNKSYSRSRVMGDLEAADNGLSTSISLISTGLTDSTGTVGRQSRRESGGGSDHHSTRYHTMQQQPVVHHHHHGHRAASHQHHHEAGGGRTLPRSSKGHSGQSAQHRGQHSHSGKRSDSENWETEKRQVTSDSEGQQCGTLRRNKVGHAETTCEASIFDQMVLIPPPSTHSDDAVASTCLAAGVPRGRSHESLCTLPSKHSADSNGTGGSNGQLSQQPGVGGKDQLIIVGNTGTGGAASRPKLKTFTHTGDAAGADVHERSTSATAAASCSGTIKRGTGSRVADHSERFGCPDQV